jgi:predicted component of type VI protein secretion system
MKKILRTKGGDRLEVDFSGKSDLSPDEIANAFYSGNSPNGMSIKKIEDGDNSVSMLKGILSNAARGFSWGASRHAEGNKEAIDKWSDKHPFIATAADIVGGIPGIGIPGVGVAKLAKNIAKIVKVAKVASKAKKTSKLAKIAGKVAKSKAVAGGITSGAYSGVRSNIESRDWDPENVAANTIRATTIGVPLGMAFSGMGSFLSKALNKSQTKAVNLIDKFGGKKNFKKIVDKAPKLIQSDDPAIKDILKNTNLTPEDKSIIVEKYVQLKEKAPVVVKNSIKKILPETEGQDLNKAAWKNLVEKRYGMADLNKAMNVPNADNEYFKMATKRAARRSPASGIDKDLPGDKLTGKQLAAVRKELYDMQNQFRGKNRNLDASEVGARISDINSAIQKENPALHKADRTFSRMKNMEKRYEEGKAFKGYKPGEAQHDPHASFVRGLSEQVKANQSNLGDVGDVSDYRKLVPNHIQNFLNTNRPTATKRVNTKLGRMAREQSNLETLMSRNPEYKDSLGHLGATAMKMLTRPKGTLVRKAGAAATSFENSYQHSPKEMAKLLYGRSKNVYNDITKQAKPTVGGKVLDTVMQSFAGTGGRGYLNRRRFNGI